MRYLVSLAFVACVLGLVLANYSVDPAERWYARFLVLAGIIFFVIAAVTQ